MPPSPCSGEVGGKYSRSLPLCQVADVDKFCPVLGGDRLAPAGWRLGRLYYYSMDLSLYCTVSSPLFVVYGTFGGFSLALADTNTVAGSGVGLFDLFKQSFDLFTVLLLIGSLVSVTVIVRCVMQITADAILPIESERRIRQNLAVGKLDELEVFVSTDDAFVSRVVHAAMTAPAGTRRSGREQAELVASEQCGNWFRKVEPLSIIGNLGPLLGLAGTVWGMIYAFTSLGSSGGQASAAALSSGIAKALFHTLLGLMLAVPSLLVYGFYKAKVDRLCTRALVISSELVDSLPFDEIAEASGKGERESAERTGKSGSGSAAGSAGSSTGSSAGSSAVSSRVGAGR